MPLSDEKQIAMFGCTLADLESGVEFYSKRRGSRAFGKLAYAVSILSDAQEVVQFANGVEVNRQLINRAKYLISDVMDAEKWGRC